MNKNKILEKLSTTPRSFKWIIRQLNISRDKNKYLYCLLSELINEKKIFINKNREYFIAKWLKTIKGIIKISSKGYGFIEQENDKSVFIKSNSTGTSFDGDIVLVKVYEDHLKHRSYFGIVTKIIKRNTTTIVGVVKKNDKYFEFKPIDKRLLMNKFRFINLDNLKGDYVIKAKIIEFKKELIFLEVLLIIGHKDDPNIDIQTVIEEYGISSRWSNKTTKEANNIPDCIKDENNTGRIDIRDRLIITIDGDDTKDLDDAIEVLKLKNGNYLLGVHVADVAHYVREGTKIDDEAKLRGTSIYLADTVIPMLPEKLSNGICSLNPNVDRFTISCEIEINSTGKTIDYKIYQSIINSKYRLTYNEVNDFYNNKKSFDNLNLNKMLNVSLELSKKIRKYKLIMGYLDFEIDESKLVFEKKTNSIIDIIARKRDQSEIMIEAFMVRANETVASHAIKNLVPFIYRVHEKPKMQKIAYLEQVVKTLGIDVLIPEEPNHKEFALLINNLKKYRFDDFIKNIILRTMSKAIYQKNNIGHFGLASKQYTHFTSPIRRYPDLIAHRMFKEYFFNKNLKLKEHFNDILDDISKNNSQSEQQAVKLERKVFDMKKAEFYSKFIGKKRTGRIISMHKFGFFVLFSDKVDGLVHIKTLVDGNYELNNNGLQMVSRKRKFTIGDMVEVVVVQADKQEGKIELALFDLFRLQKQNIRKRINGKGNRKK